MAALFGVYRVTCVKLSGVDLAAVREHDAETLFVSVKINGRFVGQSKPLAEGTCSFVADDRFVWWVDERILERKSSLLVAVEATLYAQRPSVAPRILETVSELLLVPLRTTIDPRGSILEFNCGAMLYVSSWGWRRPNRVSQQRVSRQHSTSSTQGTVAPGGAVITTLQSVQGLYRPGYDPGNLDRVRHAEYCEGYMSDDDRARIYLGRALDGTWAANTQQIVLMAKVHLVNRQRPGSLKLKWCIVECLDPSVFDPNLHPDAFATLWGTDGRNEGAWPGPPFREVEGYTLVGCTDRSAITEVDDDLQSRIEIRCPNVAGDRFKVQVVAIGDGLTDGLGYLDLVSRQVAPLQAGPQFNVADATGIMTMWKRVDVEYRKMGGALALPVDLVPVHFEPAFVQMDFLPEEPCTTDMEYLGGHDADTDLLGRNLAEQEFTRKGVGGTFCVVALREFVSPPEHVNPGSKIDIKHWSLGHTEAAYDGKFYDYVDVSADDGRKFAKAEGATIEWKNQHDDQDYVSIYFHIDNPEGEEAEGEEVEDGSWRFYLDPILITKVYDGRGDDGKKAYADGYSLSLTGVQRGDAWTDGAFGVERRAYASHKNEEGHADVFLTISTPGYFTNSGFSPSIEHDGTEYFGGRTVIATQDPDFKGNESEDALVITMVHELCHGFGLPHRCCEWDLGSVREKSCVLNYSSDWVIDANDTPLPHTSHRVGRHLCAFHAKELRRVRLENNPALRALWG